MNMWTNFQYGGQPMFGSLGRRTSANSALHYRDASIEDVLASKNPNSHNPDEPNNDRISSRQAMMFGSLSPGRQMMLQIGSGMLKNANQNPAQAFGGAMSDYLASAPEQEYRQLQTQNAWQEMDERRRRRLRENQTWDAIDKDTNAPSWARMSPEAYVDYNKQSASGAAAQKIYSQYAPMFDQGDGAAAGQDASGGDIGSAYDPARVQQLYHLKAQAELQGNNNLAQAFGAEISRMQSAADLGVKQQDLDIKRQDLEWKTGGEARNKQYLDFQSEGLKGRTSMGVYDKLDSLVQQPGFYSGWGAKKVELAKKIASAFGVDPKAVKDIESFRALTNDAIRQEIGSLGTGVSNGDVQFMVAANANLDYSPAGNRQLIGIKRRMAERKVQIAEFAREWKKQTGRKYLDDDFDAELQAWAEANPMFPEAAQDSQGGPNSFTSPEGDFPQRPAAGVNPQHMPGYGQKFGSQIIGQVRTNSRTGVKQIWDGQQWRPWQ